MIRRRQIGRSLVDLLAGRAPILDPVALGCVAAVGLMAAASVGMAQQPTAVAFTVQPPSGRLVEAEASFDGEEGIPYDYLATFIEEADKGSAAAKRDLGLLYTSGGRVNNGDPNLGLQWFEAAAVAGDSRAPAYIGDYYLDKRNGKPDVAAALFWYGKARAAKDARGTLALAGLYCNAVGVKRDVPRCGSLLDEASAVSKPSDPAEVKPNLASAEVAIGDDYHKGDGVRAQQQTAESWYAKSAALGSLPGALDQAMLYVEKPGLRQDLPRAKAILDALHGYSIFQRPAVTGAYIAVGKAYEAHGRREFAAAALIYTKVAMDFNEIAPLMSLVERYIHGDRVGVDADRAYALLLPVMRKDMNTPEDALLYKTCNDLADLYAKAKPPNTQRVAELRGFRNYLKLPPAVPMPMAMGVSAAAPMVERYPNILAPDSVAPQQEFAVNVSLNGVQFDQNTQILSGQQDKGQLQITLPDGLTTMPIQVDLIAPGMTFVNGDTNSSTLTLDENQLNSTPAVFHLRAGSAPASGVLLATLSYHQNFIAQLERTIAVVASSSPAAPNDAAQGNPQTNVPVPAEINTTPLPTPHDDTTTPATGRSDKGPLVLGKVINPAAPRPAVPSPHVTLNAPVAPVRPPNPIVIDPTRASADLTITETLVGDTMYYAFNSPALVGTVFASVPNAAATKAKVEQDFNQLQSESLLLSGGGATSDIALCTAAHAKGAAAGDKDPSCADSLQARALLQGIGSDLYNHDAPAEFRTVYQLLQQNHIRLHTITVVTNSPMLPWELMLPQEGTDNYLGLTTAMTRQNQSAPMLAGEGPEVAFSGVAVIAPNYSGDKQLPAVQTEISEIKTDFPAAQLVAGDAASVSTLVRTDPESIIHYSGHGQRIPPAANAPAALAPQAAIVLQDSSMTPETFVAFRAQGQSAHPFYFFNACDLGRADSQMDYIGGWAPALMESGASGYMGALFTIGDTSAASFAGHFYADLKGSFNNRSETMADVVTQARLQTYTEAYDPTALAYVLYAQPLLKMVAQN